MAKLLIQESNGVREFELVDQEINIGRELDNTLRLADPSISRHHAVIRKTVAGYEVQDLGSSNGVLINGVKVDSGTIKHGDRITLGQMQLTFQDPQAEEANPLGTVRMSLDEMVKIQGGPAPAAPPEPVPMAPPPPPPAPRAEPAYAAYAAYAAAADANPAPAFLQPYLPPVPDDAQPLLAGAAIERGDFGTRFVAWLIDAGIGALLGIIFFVAVAVLGAFSHGILGCFGCALYPLLGLGYLVFNLWCTVVFRATIGKKIMRLRVVPELNPTGNIDWGMAILRYLGHMVSGMLADLPYLLILTSERKGFQDMFSGSIVIKVDR
jgi:uncharacterized RDD family membrane protein YckC